VHLGYGLYVDIIDLRGFLLRLTSDADGLDIIIVDIIGLFVVDDNILFGGLIVVRELPNGVE